MNIDIIRKIKLSHSHVKANFETLRVKHKFFLIVFLFSILATVLPHETYAATANLTNQINNGPALVFNLDDLGYQDYLEMRQQELNDQYYQERVRQQALRLRKLTKEVQNYLAGHNSPLADHVATLVTLRNWKKIVALANAESSMCLRYPQSKANCWGVGGADLWDMGNNLGDGIITMNHFLNKYPLGSKVKYAEMSFDRMNGFYKQPAADHWLYNNTSIYEDLAAIENSIQ